MKFTLVILLFLFTLTGNSQSCYTGYLGKYSITLVMYHYSDDISHAYYVYNKYDNPIKVNGSLKEGELKLFEKDKSANTLATLIFKNFKKNDKIIKGKWTNKSNTEGLQILLKKDFDITNGDNVEWDTKELIQSSSTKNHYFKTIITKEVGRFYGRIIGVKIFEKETDRLIQTIDLDCQLFGIDSVRIGDYNFDGIEDFSVFETSYAGPNTSSIYILRDVNSDKYIVSDFKGVSLEFDKDSKLIYEHNQCCAGRSHMNATYKVVNNTMVLVQKKCIEYDSEKEDFIEVDCE
ncbi:XAC2610-related protein [Mangrovimonas spongiae]|uniref:XAC2610-related protein n=1 Tax=Mangrovimonas spongiae TaxID=2494697 RepID=UPI00197FC8F9|nr:hypothetical protein [Mangrovimonas spongiae]